MFIASDHFSGYRGTEQFTTRGAFLLLLQPNVYKDAPADYDVPRPCKWLDIAGSCAPENTYATVRKVALRQLGQFMMGSANLCGRWVTVSGAYGSDGLPMSVDKLPKDAVKLPRELYDAWNKGGGWNGPGAERDALRTWARETFEVKP